MQTLDIVEGLAVPEFEGGSPRADGTRDQRMKNLLIGNLNGRKLLLLFILTNAVYAAMLTITIPMVTAHAGGQRTTPPGQEARQELFRLQEPREG